MRFAGIWGREPSFLVSAEASFGTEKLIKVGSFAVKVRRQKEGATA
jgi:hypothetical protein